MRYTHEIYMKSDGGPDKPCWCNTSKRTQSLMFNLSLEHQLYSFFAICTVQRRTAVQSGCKQLVAICYSFAKLCMKLPTATDVCKRSSLLHDSRLCFINTPRGFFVPARPKRSRAFSFSSWPTVPHAAKSVKQWQLLAPTFIKRESGLWQIFNSPNIN